MHLAVVANCQARPIATLIKALLPAIAEPSTIIVHLAGKDRIDDDYAVLDTADLIFAQLVTDQYFAGHLATSRLKARYGARVISWPNVFFRGQTPDLAYASVTQADEPARKRLLGPLREYHHRGIFEAWQAGINARECLAVLAECSLSFQEHALSVADRSLEDLRQREAALDVAISGVITAEWRRRRLFFTFNHPSAYLLSEMARRLLLHAGVETAGNTHSEREPLDLVIPPVFGRDAAFFGPALENSGTSRGAELLIDGADVKQGSIRLYTHSELIEASFHAYDAQLSREDTVAFSPP
jgi:hypothetical protein